MLPRIGPRGAVAALSCAALVLAPVRAASAGGSLHVQVSVPSVAAATATNVWVANTGTGSVLEFGVSSGKEIRDIKGSKYSLYNPDAMLVLGKDVWVADASSNTLTEFLVRNGDFVHLLRGGKYVFGNPRALATTDGNIFVLGRQGDEVSVIHAKDTRLVAAVRGRHAHLIDAIALAAVGQNVWALSVADGGFLTELRGSDGHVERVVSAKSAKLDRPTGLAAYGSQLWVSNAGGQHLSIVSGRTGALLGTSSIKKVDLDAVSSLLLTQGRLWLTSNGSKPWVACVSVLTGKVLRLDASHFTYPAAFFGPSAVFVTDRLQSRVTVFAPRAARVLRVLVN